MDDYIDGLENPEVTIFPDGSRTITMNGQELFGYCRYAAFYRDCVSIAKEEAHFVEVGSFLGLSSCIMGHYIKKSNKKIIFDCVDLFEISESSDDLHATYVEKYGGDFLQAFTDNIKNSGMSDYINNIYKGHSSHVSQFYENESLDMVYLDASHYTVDVIDDIRNWYPKLKPGGVLAGDDWDHEGVAPAVCWCLGELGIPITDLNSTSYATWFIKK